MYREIAEDTIPVPLGTRIYDARSEEQLIDITEIGRVWTAVSGGRGGLRNVHFKSSTNRALRLTMGKPAEEKQLKLGLMLMADVGLLDTPMQENLHSSHACLVQNQRLQAIIQRLPLLWVW